MTGRLVRVEGHSVRGLI